MNFMASEALGYRLSSGWKDLCIGFDMLLIVVNKPQKGGRNFPRSLSRDDLIM